MKAGYGRLGAMDVDIATNPQTFLADRSPGVYLRGLQELAGQVLEVLVFARSSSSVEYRLSPGVVGHIAFNRLTVGNKLVVIDPSPVGAENIIRVC